MAVRKEMYFSFARRNINQCSRRRKGTASQKKPFENNHENFTNAPKSFDEIPEAKGQPIIGTLLDYTPFRGFSIEYIHKLWRKRHKTYGSIFKERLPGFTKHVVFCCSEQDVAAMRLSDEKFPMRETAPALKRIKEKIGMPDSFFNLHGEAWYRYRSVVNSLFLRNEVVWRFTQVQREVCRDLVKYIDKNTNEDGEVPDFAKVLDRWSFEIAGTFVIDTRLGLLSEAVDHNLESLIDCHNEVISFIANSLYGLKLWRYFDTKDLRNATASFKSEIDYLKPTVSEHISNRSRDCNAGNTIMQTILKCPQFTDDEAFSILIDLFTGAIDTTSKSAALALYCLTLNPEAQERLRAEVFQSAADGAISGRSLANLKYMNAFLKEVFRYTPFSLVFNRWYTKEVVLSGYRIPPGIQIHNTANSTQNMNPDLFPEPDHFLPERWLRSTQEGGKNRNRNYFTGPFGFGARSCPGRRFAMQEIRLLLLEILLKYRVEYHHTPINSIFRATAAPSEPPQFKFAPL